MFVNGFCVVPLLFLDLTMHTVMPTCYTSHPRSNKMIFHALMALRCCSHLFPFFLSVLRELISFLADFVFSIKVLYFFNVAFCDSSATFASLVIFLEDEPMPKY